MTQSPEETREYESPEPMCEILKRRSQAARKAKFWRPKPPPTPREEDAQG